MEGDISHEQARVIAACIAHDIRAYIDDHQEEYRAFLVEYGYEPDTDGQAPRACTNYTTEYRTKRKEKSHD